MLLYGNPVRDNLKKLQAERVKHSGIRPKLAIIQAGDNLASTTYIQMKQRYGKEIGVEVEHVKSSGELNDLLAAVQSANDDHSVNGIIVQLPLPDRSITDKVVEAIYPAKDVDGLGPRSHFESATAMAVIKLLEHYDIDLRDVPIAMVGTGRLVGRPLTGLLQERGADVTVADIDTTPEELKRITKQARIVVSATGVGSLIKPDMISDGSVIIDVGTAEDEGSIVGDIDPAVLENETLKVTPAKGGIGPITVSTLFEQLLKAAKL